MNRISKIITLLFLICLVVFVSNQTPSKSQSNDFLSTLNKITSKSYTVHDVSSYASSGGGRKTDEIKKITNTELKEIIHEIQNVNINNSFVDKNKTCFYNLNDHGGPLYLFCFARDKIVNYIRNDGPGKRSWYVPGYENINRSVVIDSIPDLQSCNTDSDCTLEGVGVCIPKERVCQSNSANCDSGYRVSINSKYSFVWSHLQYVEDECIVNDTYATYERGEYYKATCEAHMCKTLVIQGN